MIPRKRPSATGEEKISHAFDEDEVRESDKKTEHEGSSKGLADNGVYFFNSNVDSSSIGSAIEFILEANLDRECEWDFITMLINSPGGYVTDGFALIDVMHSSTIPIHTVGLGMIASMGLQLFLAGAKGH